MLTELWEQYRTVVEFSLANALFALGTWVAMWAGVFSMGGAAFGAAGGFTVTYLDAQYGLHPALQMLIGGLIGLVLAAILSMMLLKLESHWMAMATIALVLITRVVVLSAEDYTGGSVGIGVEREINLLTLIALVVVICYALARLRKSKFGMAAHAVREDSAVAAAMGIDPFKIRAIAFSVSGLIGGLSGVVMANLLQYIGPDTFYMTLAFTMVAAMVLGGTYHWLGPVVGAFVFVGLPETMRTYAAEYDELATGALLVLIMVFLPRGLIDPRRSWFGRRKGEESPPFPAKEIVKEEVVA